MDRWTFARITMVASLSLTAGVLFLLQACGGGGGASGGVNSGGGVTAWTQHYAYVANHGDPTTFTSGDVSAFAITVSGTLSQIACVSGAGTLCNGSDNNFSVGNYPNFVAIHPSGKFVYVVNGFLPGGGVGVYTINASSGSLTQIACASGNGVVCSNGGNYDTGGLPLSVAFDHFGKFAYVVNNGSNTGGDVSAFAVSAAGTLTPVACVSGNGVTCNGSNFVVGIYPSRAVSDPSGKFLYVTNTGEADISAFVITATGALTPIACVSGNGVVCNGSKFAAGSSPADLIFDLSGKFAYAVNHGGDVSAYSVTTIGTLIQIACVSGNGVVCNGSNFTAGGNSLSIAIDPSGRHIYVVNSVSNDVTVFATTAGGALIQIACVSGNGVVCNGNNFSAGTAPMAVSIDSSGIYAYVVNQGAGNGVNNITKGDVSAYAITATGALTPIACVSGSAVLCSGSNFSAGADSYSIAITP